MAKKDKEMEEVLKEEPTPEPEPTEDYKIVNTANGPMKRYYADSRLEKI